MKIAHSTKINNFTYKVICDEKAVNDRAVTVL